MKKVFVWAFLLVSLLAVNTAVAQETATVTPRGDGVLVTWSSVTLDSAETAWSNVLSFPKNDGFSYTTYPWTVSYKASQGDSTAYVYLYGSNDNSNYHLVDTLATIANSTAANTTANFNNKKFRYWKAKFVGGDVDTLKFELYQPRGDGY